MIRSPHELESARGERAAASPVFGRRSPAPAGGGEPKLRDLVRVLYDGRWFAVAVASAILAAAVGYLLLAHPTFEARAVIQVEDTSPTIAGLEALSAVFSDKRPAETEIAIMRSQVLVGGVVAQLGLDVEVREDQPLLGRLRRSLLERLRGRDEVGLRVRELSVPERLLDRDLVLTALGEGRWSLAGPDGQELLRGELRRRESAPPGTAEDRRVALVVSDLSAPAGSRFAVRLRDRGEVVEELRQRLGIWESGRGTGIIEASLEGPDPEQVAAILNALANGYLRQNVERKSAEAEKTLAFLDGQLPALKANVDRADLALQEFQTRKGTMSLSRKSETMVNQTVEVERELSQLELERTELRQRFTGEHPSVASVEQKIEQLRGKRALVGATMRQIPAAELEAARLMRDHKLASELYDVLLNKAQELKVLRSGIVGNVRILDHARAPRQPARPRRGMVLLAGLVLGVGGGIAATLARRALDEGADDPDEIEARAGVPVYVTIPHSDREQKLLRGARHGGAAPPLVALDPGDPTVEGLRSLRTALQFALVGARSKVIGVTSPSPGAGKSFVCSNLALLLAAADTRVLLVDADLRRGRLHRGFGVPRQPGLSDVLTGGATEQAAIQPGGVANLFVLPTGRIPPNPAELLASAAFEDLVGSVAARFDFVVLDTPPVLAVTDPTIVARCTGVNLLVLRAGEHPMREIVAAVRHFSQSGFPIQGAILNDARSSRSGYGRYGRYYEYRSQHPKR